jgi:hypothetical protein
MTESSTANDVQVLIQEGHDALRHGNAYEARKRFRQAIELEPENIDALIGMVDSLLPYKDKRDHLIRILDLDPNNAEARARLEEVEARLANGEVLAPKPKPEPLPASDTHPTSTSTEIEVLCCYRHPDRETGLRCTQCGNPICAECARSALVGQLCPDCARERRPPNYQVTAANLAVAAVTTLVISGILSFLVVWILGRFLFIGIIAAMILGPAVARLIVRLLDYITRAKRGKSLQLAVGISFGVGITPMLVLTLLVQPTAALILLLFGFTAITTTMYQLR